MPTPALTTAEARRILRLARDDRAAARAALAPLTPRAQAALLCQSPPSFRSALFDLVESPEAVVPHLPAAELCFTARALGPSEAGWLLGCATPAQLVALVDLDAWAGFALDHARLGEWLPALAAAGDETLLRAARALDLEALMLHLRARAHVTMNTGADDWAPPPGAHTLDGVFHLSARAPGDDLADLLRLLRVLFQGEYWRYFRLVQSCIWELESENEEYALRWRRGRLQDAGFPDPADAKRVYSHLREDQLARLPAAPATAEAADAARAIGAGASVEGANAEDARASAAGAGDAESAYGADADAADDAEFAVAGDGLWLPALVERAHPEFALFRALRELAPPERTRVRGAFLELANRVALADAAPLGEIETLREVLEKAARLASLGLAHLARANQLTPPEALSRALPERLFQIGHNLEKREAARTPDAAS